MLKINCRACDKLLREDSAFCSHCGTSVYNRGAVFNPVMPVFQTPEENPVWGNFKQILILYASLLGASLIFGLTAKISKHPLVDVGFWMVLIGIIFFYLFKNWNDLKTLFIFKLQTAATYLMIAAVAVCCVIFLNMYFSVFGLLKSEMTNSSSSILKFGWPVWSVYILVSLLPGILEEIAFRGIIYNKLKETFSTKEALILQAAGFSILHLLPTIFISHFVMGLFFGWVREKTGSIHLSVLFHMGWNASVVYFEMYR